MVFCTLDYKAGILHYCSLNNQILTPFIQVAPYLKNVNAYGSFNANWRIDPVDTSKVYLSELAFLTKQ